MSWDRLSMAEKAEIMKLAVEGGVYDLDAIRNGYNEYAKGGKIHIAPSKRGTFTAAASKHGKSVQAFASQVLSHPENYSPAMRKKANFARNAAKWKHGLGGNLYGGDNPNGQQMVTTGGAGYVPPIIDASKTKQNINKRLYRTISPLEADYSLLPALQSFLSNKEHDDTRDGVNEVYPVGTIDAIWAKYLQVPEKDRKYSDRLEKSSYRPSKGNNSDNYYKLPLQDYEKESLVDTTRELPLYKNKVSKLLNNYALGEHTVGRGYDNRGEYVSYFDVFDINPFNGKYRGINIPIVNKLDDIGIGKPVRIYDRIYLDDYYGVKEPTHATYLPEITVTGKKRKTFGGNLYGGGSSLVGMPALPALSLRNAIAKRLYENTDALDGYDVGEFITNTAIGRSNDNLKNMREHLKFKLSQDTSDNEITRRWKGELNQVDIADELYAQYLGIPVKYRHTDVRLQKSPYRDAYKMPITDAEWEKIIRETNNLNVGENASSGVFRTAGLNVSSIGKGRDKKGEYRSYGDSFDLNPFRGKAAIMDIPGLNKINDISLGMFHPVEVYDRLYLDDYYGVPKEARGGNFLPEITVTGKKKKK